MTTTPGLTNCPRHAPCMAARRTLSARLAQRQRLRAQFLDWQAPLLSVPPAEMRSLEQAARWATVGTDHTWPGVLGSCWRPQLAFVDLFTTQLSQIAKSK